MRNMEKRASVLVVEDEWLVSDMISSVLEHEGYDVQVASNAREALEFLKSDNPPDVLFTDINLDGQMKGDELAQCARIIRPEIPVVYASGRPSKFDRERQVSGSTFLPKPYSPYEVCKLVAKAVGKAAA
jgi:CheY-like chemotaxis protein